MENVEIRITIEGMDPMVKAEIKDKLNNLLAQYHKGFVIRNGYEPYSAEFVVKTIAKTEQTVSVHDIAPEQPKMQEIA